MQSPGMNQVRIPGLMQIISRRKKKGAKKMSVKFGEFYDTSEKTVQFGEDIEAVDNYPLYVAPYYGSNVQIHMRNQAECRIFGEDGSPIEGFEGAPESEEAVLEAFVLSEEDQNDESPNVLVFDALSVDGEDMSEMPFSERYERLLALAEEDDSFLPIEWKKVETFEEFSEYAGTLVDNGIPGARVKKPDSSFGEEVFINLSESDEENLSASDSSKLGEETEEEPFVPVGSGQTEMEWK